MRATYTRNVTWSYFQALTSRIMKMKHVQTSSQYKRAFIGVFTTWCLQFIKQKRISIQIQVHFAFLCDFEIFKLKSMIVISSHKKKKDKQQKNRCYDKPVTCEKAIVSTGVVSIKKSLNNNPISILPFRCFCKIPVWRRRLAPTFL